MDRIVKVHFPVWAVVFYGVIAVMLIPWIFDLAANLPSHHEAKHWDTLWAGFDLIMLITILLTIYFALKQSVWVVMSGAALATLFVVDVWFDTLTAKSGSEQRQALFFGFFELLLAALTFRLVFKVVHLATPEKNVKIGVKSNK